MAGVDWLGGVTAGVDWPSCVLPPPPPLLLLLLPACWLVVVSYDIFLVICDLSPCPPSFHGLYN